MGDRIRKQPSVRTPPPLDGVETTGSPHAQFPATEHWSLLATRSMTWNEIFSRTGTYLTALSATVIALSLVANATGFGPSFQTFALLVLPVVLLVGVGAWSHASHHHRCPRSRGERGLARHHRIPKGPPGNPRRPAAFPQLTTRPRWSRSRPTSEP
jgi:hypothetical protein